MNYPITFDEMAQAMLFCEQTKGQTVYQHGYSVWEHVQDIFNHLNGRNTTYDWKLPDWIDQYKSNILSLIEDKISDIQVYCIYHDCGKPYCKQVDATDKVHFPDHAAVSETVFLCAGGEKDIAKLIGWDMVLHTSKAEEIEQYMEVWSQSEAMILLIAALAEIHSNAKLFGGFDSTSFKIKWKTIDKRGRQICKRYFGK